ncbi:MAG: CoA transferase [Sandaracinaceae bacterium]|nr:CoA transferase [Sandaracinaceae bacterium]
MASDPMLRGLKVLDFSQNLPGPYATFLLSGWGADVVKVEPPKGDPARHIEPFFSMVNRGKRSVVLDLRDPTSLPALEALVRWADVLVDGFRPGVMARLGCGYERARELNPRLVYCSISAFGQEGPLREHPGHDLNLQALAGVCHLERDADDTPRGSVVPIADLSTSLVAVGAINAALLARERDGEGRYLDVAMADAVLSFANVWGLGIDFAGRTEAQLAPGGAAAKRLARPFVARLERLKLYAMPQYGVYRCKGNGHLSLGIVDEAHFWKALCEVLGLGPAAKLPMPGLVAMGPVLRPLIAARLRLDTAERWTERLRAAGVPVWPVRTPEEAAREPQVQARGLADARGWMRAPLPDAAHPSAPAPKKGEHTEAILSGLGVLAPASARA